MTSPSHEPSAAQAAAIDRFADALYDLLHERAQSIGLLDIGIERNDWHVDGELLFTTSPDMGLSLDAAAGVCRYCELVDDADERWLDETRSDLPVLEGDDAALRDLALLVLDGLLAARRPLLKREG